MANFLIYWIVLLLTDMTTIVYRVARSRPLWDSQLILLGLLGAAAAWRTLYWLVLYPKYFTPFRHLPTPSKRKLLTGNEDGFFRERKWDVARRWYKTIPNEGLIRYYSALSHEILLVTSPKGLSEVMVQNVHDFDQTPLATLQAERLTGRGIQFLRGQEHKTQRKYLMPIFTPAHIKTLVPVFWSKAVELVHGLQQEIQQSPAAKPVVHLTNWSVRVALDVIGVAAMDYDYGALKNPDSEYKDLIHLYRRVMANAPPSSFRILGLLADYVDPKLLYYIPESRNMILKDSFTNLRMHARNTIEAIKNGSGMEKNKDDRKDVISVALRNGQIASNTLEDHVMTFHAAGHITTSITVDWTMYELGQRPELQQRLREEIRTRLPGGIMEDINTTDIESLPLLNAVCSETLRFYPALPYTTRVAVNDTTILGTRVPQGTTVAWCADAINRDTDLWGPDGDIWNHERWMGPGRTATGGAKNNFSFLTFSAGPKNCIGQAWARAELACLVAAMVGRFDIRLANPESAAHVDPVTALMSKEGVYVSLRTVPGW